jgi:uncharacterized tellurite resistance protein B-like protein
MGLLSRLTAGVTPTKKATDDVLLLHTMFLMMGADGAFDDEEWEMLESYFFSLPEFEGKEFQTIKEQCHKLLSKYPNLQDSVKALADFTNPTIKKKAYVVAADIAMASGDVDEAEDKMLDAMQRVLGVDDATAQKVLEVLSMKYAR